MAEVLLALLIAKVLQGVWPQEITHGSKCWGLLKPIQLGHRQTYSKEDMKYTYTHCFVPLSCVKKAAPSLCHLNCVFLGRGHREHTGTAGSWEQPEEGNRMHPYRNHTPALNTWFYLKKTMIKKGSVWDILQTEWLVSTIFIIHSDTTLMKRKRKVCLSLWIELFFKTLLWENYNLSDSNTLISPPCYWLFSHSWFYRFIFIPYLFTMSCFCFLVIYCMYFLLCTVLNR